MRPWIKLHTTRLDDVRLLRLNERQQLRYFQMYLLAGRLNVDGLFTENNERLNERDIAIKLRITDIKQFTADFKALKSAGLIKANGHGPYIADFTAEQVDWNKLQQGNRERQARFKKSNAKVTRDESVNNKKSRVTNALVTPLDQDQDQDQIKKKTKIKTKKKTKTKPPSKPSSTKSKAAVLAGGGGSTSSLSSNWMSGLSQQEQQIAPIIHPIMRSAGLGHEKIINLINSVAIRITPSEAKRITLAALASVYSDDEVHNKPMVAMHRMINQQIPSLFMNSNTWKIIPAEVLEAADIDLNRLPREYSTASLSKDNDVIKRVAANVG